MIEEMNDAAIDSLKLLHVLLQGKVLQHHRNNLRGRK
jgi:hypothetical protein